MEVSTRAKERFCKDCNIPIRIFQEPYFTDILALYDKFYGTLEKWDIFLSELSKYNCEQDYFEEYNRVKDAAILDIKNTEAYHKFNEEDMNKYAVTHKNLPNKDIFKSSNDGKCFISIDMRKANFSSLHHYNSDIFGGAESWEEFIGRYTGNQHIINSKYIRQVILGNCNPKRHITYEKYLMDGALTYLTEVFISMDRVVFFSNDEIVVDVSDMDKNKQERIVFAIRNGMKDMPVPLKTELFILHKIVKTDGYYKEIIDENDNTEIEFKCLDNYALPFVLRKFLGEDVTENDKIFYHEGLLAKFIETPQIEVNIDEKN
ncbi:hypothetical protein C823_007789 [Eubacterium plexicaudatum ASF492]|uniref:Uncharacterized protein n=1 Tax=Eubacterium plexicaudatum ASF492 TaxID=1235802 RepID=N2A4X0_9FIRM|nr:hypothetical protein C823_007789 [Eubacterium plexicaudatum ASF492]